METDINNSRKKNVMFTKYATKIGGANEREGESKPLRGFVKFFFSFFLFATLFFTVRSSVYAAIYCNDASYLNNCYVDGNAGSDTLNDGKTPTTAWQTIQKAATLLQPGDTVNVKGGITYNTLGSSNCSGNGSAVVCPVNSGSSGNQITYQAWSGTGIPIIDASGKQAGFHANGKDYITIKGFEVKNAGGANLWLNGGTAGIIASNNIVHSGNSIGIYVVDFSSGVKVYNNTVYNNGGDGIQYLCIGGTIIKNNIVVGNSGNGIKKSAGTISPNYNLVWNNTTNYSGVSAGANDVSSDPFFLNASGNDFRIPATSPAKNAGVTLSEVVADILGVSRPQGSAFDIGAYEYYDIPVTVVAVSSPTSNTKPTLTGTASTISGVSISSISYSIDSSSWTSSGVTGTTSFSIVIPTALSDGAHTIRVRATDSNGNVTDSSLYGSTVFTVDATAPVEQELLNQWYSFKRNWNMEG
ncbi:MAG: Ig-like domain-containing protein [Candidatus Roizmanbacteria bacterium]|nr:Ig-like domain-containing protein [Candidatus Roizmanbacteria bacterium]